MGIQISEEIYNYILNYGGEGAGADFVFEEDGEYFFIGDWEDFGLQEQDGGVWTISSRPSQIGVFVGYIIP